MIIGLKIKEIAEEKNISPKELADGIGRTRQAVYDIYSGKVSVNVDLLEKICKVLGIEMHSIFLSESIFPHSKDELKKVISGVTNQIIEGNYIDLTTIKTLIINILQNAYDGKGLVNLELLKHPKTGKFVLKAEYRPLKTKLTDGELKDFAKPAFSKFFTEIKSQVDAISYEKIIEKYIDSFSKE